MFWCINQRSLIRGGIILTVTQNGLKEKQTLRHDRRISILICILAVVLCVAYAWFRKDLPEWWRQSGGGIPYTLFFVTFFFALSPKRRLLKIVTCLAVGWSCAAEILQLWQPRWLVEFRATPFGAALLGSSFTWSDIPPYFYWGRSRVCCFKRGVWET